MLPTLSNSSTFHVTYTDFKFGKKESSLLKREVLAVEAVYCALHSVLHGVTLSSFHN